MPATTASTAAIDLPRAAFAPSAGAPSVGRRRSRPAIVIAGTDLGLSAAPIEPSWILEGQPEARCRTLAMSRDRTSCTMLWDCTPGRFNWFYGTDETIHLIEGSVTLTDQDGTRRVKAGDMVFFPAGSHAEWHVETPVRKIAFLRKQLPHPLGFFVRAWHKAFGQAGGL